MCDLICDVITCFVEAKILVKSVLMLKSRLKTRKKENVEISISKIVLGWNSQLSKAS